MVAFESVEAPLNLPVLVGVVLLAGLVGFVLTLVVGDAYLTLVGGMSYWRISAAVLALLCVISYLFTGPLGVGVFVAAAAVGMVPVRLRARWVHLMGVLIGPLMLGP